MKPLLPHFAPLDDQALIAELEDASTSPSASPRSSPTAPACSSYLTTLRTVAPHLDDDHKLLLEAAAGKSKRQVQELVVASLPEQPAVSSVRKLPDLPPSRRPVVAPVSANQYRITITASREMKDELSRVQDLLRHQIPDGDPGKILARALTLLREQLERKKIGGAKSKKGRKTRPGSTVQNISLRCHAHNAHEAVAWFGPHEPTRELVPARVGPRSSTDTAAGA